MTTTTNEKSLLLKTDVLGRVHMPRDRREAILDAFERSAMSGQAFAAHIGVKYPTLMTWAQKRRRERGDYADKRSKKAKPSGITLVEAMVDSDDSTGKRALEVETAQGLKLRIRSREDAALAAELLRALTKGSAC